MSKDWKDSKDRILVFSKYIKVKSVTMPCERCTGVAF